jgi:hypothetical protein
VRVATIGQQVAPEVDVDVTDQTDVEGDVLLIGLLHGQEAPQQTVRDARGGITTATPLRSEHPASGWTCSTVPSSSNSRLMVNCVASLTKHEPEGLLGSMVIPSGYGRGPRVSVKADMHSPAV